MAVHFHPLKVKAVEKETADCVVVSFDIPEALQAAFVFEQGQNITLKKTINNQELRRSYSICTAPFEKELKVAIKHVGNGAFSTYANNSLKAGDVIDVLPPTGKFNTALNAGNKKKYLAFAAGSGITPIISIIKTTLQAEPNSHFTLVFGNRSRASIIFFEALEALKNKYLSRFTLIHLLSREKTDVAINFGKIDTEKLQALENLIAYNSFDECFICGPEAMIFCVKDFLLQKNIDSKKIHFELFATPGQKKQAISTTINTNTTGPQSKVTIQLDGRNFDISIPLQSDITILDAAMQQGADVPYACKGGVCCTCKAKLLQGEVNMEVNWGLEHDEVEQGFILTCQAHPITETVVVDFDIK
jgi:ring-1,2-phenylacetyl-CoA epoxidase subunit PaaE